MRVLLEVLSEQTKTLVSLDLSLNDLGREFLTDFPLFTKLLTLKIQGSYTTIEDFHLARNLLNYFNHLNIHLLEPSFTLTPNVLAYYKKYFHDRDESLLNLTY